MTSRYDESHQVTLAFQIHDEFIDAAELDADEDENIWKLLPHAKSRGARHESALGLAVAICCFGS